MMGYIAAEWNKTKYIHGLGEFFLHKNEAWIGPVYVLKKYRNKGISSYLIGEICQTLKMQYDIANYYTCINASNQSSLHSFQNNGFEKIGSIDIEADRCFSDFIDSSIAERFKRS